MKIIVWGNGRLGSAMEKYIKSKGFECVVKSRNAPLPPKGDAIIDFSSPEALDEVLMYALEHRLPLVIGVTGHSVHQIEQIHRVSCHIPIVYESNFSIGVFALKQAALILKKLLPAWEIGILERHHKEKKDSPSGTALALDTFLYADQICSIRLGEEKGTHHIIYAGEGEEITLSHSAHSLDAFCCGALTACKFIMHSSNGLIPFDQIISRGFYS